MAAGLGALAFLAAGLFAVVMGVLMFAWLFLRVTLSLIFLPIKLL